jgi:hypothetical protein
MLLGTRWQTHTAWRAVLGEQHRIDKERFAFPPAAK